MTAVRFNHGAGQIQAQSGALCFPAERIVHAVEALEDSFLLISRQPDTLILNGERDTVIIEGAADAHFAAFGRILDRIIDQVIDDLPQTCFIPLNDWEVLREINNKLVNLCLRLEAFSGTGSDSSQIHVPDVGQAHPIGLQFRCREQILDQVGQPIRFFFDHRQTLLDRF